MDRTSSDIITLYTCFLCHSPLLRSYYYRSFCYRQYAALSGPCTSPRHAPSCFLCHSPLSRIYYLVLLPQFLLPAIRRAQWALHVTSASSSRRPHAFVHPYYATLGCRETRAVLVTGRPAGGCALLRCTQSLRSDRGRSPRMASACSLQQCSRCILHVRAGKSVCDGGGTVESRVARLFKFAPPMCRVRSRTGQWACPATRAASCSEAELIDRLLIVT